MKKIIILFVWLLLGVLGATALAAGELPQRIVSLGPFLTEEIYMLDAADTLVGVTTFCQRPPQAQQLEKVGGVVEINPERIIALAPEVVLSTPLTAVKAKQRLHTLGIRMIDFKQPEDFEDICGQFQQVAALVGREERASEIIERMRQRLAAVKARIASLPALSVFVQVGSRPLFTMPRGYFVNDIIEKAGGRNIAAEARSGLYSREKVVDQNPDAIIIATMGMVGDEEERVWRQYASITAVQENRIFTMDPYLVCSPTPVNFVAAVEQLAAFLHPQGEKNSE